MDRQSNIRICLDVSGLDVIFMAGSFLNCFLLPATEACHAVAADDFQTNEELQDGVHSQDEVKDEEKNAIGHAGSIKCEKPKGPGQYE